MANEKSSGEYYEYATVDTDPGADGFFTNPVSPRGKKVSKLFFSIRETSPDSVTALSTITVVLQFKCAGDAEWQDYYNDGNAFVTGERKMIEDDAGGVMWRAGVKDADSSFDGSVTFGFDW